MSRSRRSFRFAVLLALTAVALPQTGCIDYLYPGEFGRLRYLGQVRGDAPLRMIPPISDRVGNAYVLYGSRDIAEVMAYVGHAGGGWSGGCDVHEGADRGVHGWVGRAEDRAWYWSGDSLVEVSGSTGGCGAVLDVDPASGADLAFLAVVPWVRETPSRTTIVAVVQSPADPLPYQVVVDLDLGLYTELQAFEPRAASDVTVLGVGAHPGTGEGVIVFKYFLEGAQRVEARFVDVEGNVTHIAPLAGAEAFGEDSVLGYVAIDDTGLAAGLLETGQLLIFNRSGGGVSAGSAGIVPAGVHHWGGALWLVGTGGGRPTVASLGAGGAIGTPLAWQTSEQAAAFLRGDVLVMDDRTHPFRHVEWRDTRTAIGDFPFVSPHGPDPYAIDTTAWLVAGPTYSVAGEIYTAVAFAPVGISYP